MAPSDRSERGRLQAILGELGDVQPYRWTSPDLEHDTGWYVTPAGPALLDCHCGLCTAARDGEDVHLGSTSRVAHLRALRLVTQHMADAA